MGDVGKLTVTGEFISQTLMYRTGLKATKYNYIPTCPYNSTGAGFIEKKNVLLKQKLRDFKQVGHVASW